MAARRRKEGGYSYFNDGNSKKIRREFLLKTEERLGEYMKTAYICSNFRNIYYNIMEEKKLDVNEVAIILWAYPYEFFSRAGIADKCRIGWRGVNNCVKSLVDKGYVEKYSPEQTLTEDVYVKAKLEGMNDYLERRTFRLAPRYKLTSKATRLCESVYKEIDSGIVDAVRYAERDDVERSKFIKIKMPS